jgi:hypothetical protein
MGIPLILKFGEKQVAGNQEEARNGNPADSPPESDAKSRIDRM